MNIFSKIFLCFIVYSLSILSLLSANESCINEKIITKYANVIWKHQCLSHNLVLITRLPHVKQTNIVDENGRTVFPLSSFDRIWNASVLIAFIDEFGNLYFYDVAGKEKYRYKYIGSFTDDIAIILAKEKNKVVLVDIEGKIISPNYDFLSPISEGLAVVANDGVFGYLNEYLEMVIPLQFDLAQPFSNGLASVRKNGKYGFINQTGQVIIPFIYDDSYTAFSNGLTAVKKQEKWGLIDIAGDIIAPFIYDDIWAFSEGLAIVKRAGKRGFINTHGKEIIPVKFDDAISFYHGVARVKTNEKWEFINKEGKNIN